MFVHRIGNLDKTSFGTNFKAEDIKCELKENKELKKQKYDTYNEKENK